MQVLHLLSGPNMGFSPDSGDTHWSDKREIWHRGVDRAKFHIHQGRNVGIQPPKPSNFQILPTSFPLGSDSFAQFLWNSQHL